MFKAAVLVRNRLSTLLATDPMKGISDTLENKAALVQLVAPII